MENKNQKINLWLLHFGDVPQKMEYCSEWITKNVDNNVKFVSKILPWGVTFPINFYDLDNTIWNFSNQQN